MPPELFMQACPTQRSERPVPPPSQWRSSAPQNLFTSGLTWKFMVHRHACPPALHRGCQSHGSVHPPWRPVQTFDKFLPASVKACDMLSNCNCTSDWARDINASSTLGSYCIDGPLEKRLTGAARATPGLRAAMKLALATHNPGRNSCRHCKLERHLARDGSLTEICGHNVGLTSRPVCLCP